MAPRLITSASVALMLLIGLGFGTANAAPTSQPSDDSNAQLRKEVEDLKAKVSDLEARQDNSAAVDQQIINDADKHSEFLTSINYESGYDPTVGFVLRSDDG